MGKLRLFIVVLLALVVSFAGGLVARGQIERDGQLTAMAQPTYTLEPQPYTLPLQYSERVIYYCDKYQVPVWLASRLFQYESGWKERAAHFNDNGTVDRGLAQLNSANYSEFSTVYNAGVRLDPTDPETAIRVGVRYLADLHARYGSWRMAVVRYAGRRSDQGTRWILNEGGH